MAKQKKITQARIIDIYMDEVVQLGEKPESIASFLASHNFDEEDFYTHFENFEKLDKTIFSILIETSIATLAESGEFLSFSKKDKLLSLYYTLFENLNLNRDFALICIKSYGISLDTITLFSGLKEQFIAFMNSLGLETLSLNIDTLETIQKKSINEGAWVQLLLTIKFWMTDDSNDCEKTDIFIEKSINTGVELLNTKSLNNIIDLGKFLYTEKFKS
ncbi:TetR/AcrR family transcriptional regulator [Dokdonia sinensis]|uniref:TetR/AcrR family transcriptional regulator n=1 Tax=Dokdonia sinensis TaxID=2479847 RepID=A0A3M0G7R8_9FLAO|nr:TetR family transcriptional regulator C-terminal domain-containing protein [Dokdonia sinensis]RMB60528.1 TetR/AcrR family transcriptional regulator [Dokdonia sinensis]